MQEMKAHPQNFDLSKIPENLGKIPENPVKSLNF